jgi:hypothetical protein
MTIVLREREKDILVKQVRREEIDGQMYKFIRYEWWHDKEKMKQGIPAEDIGENTYIYCSGYAGCTDEEAIKWFENGLKTL